jgi:hypothetical protein
VHTNTPRWAVWNRTIDPYAPVARRPADPFQPPRTQSWGIGQYFPYLARSARVRPAQPFNPFETSSLARRARIADDPERSAYDIGLRSRDDGYAERWTIPADRFEPRSTDERKPDERMARLPVSIVAEVDPESLHRESSLWHTASKEPLRERASRPGAIEPYRPAAERYTRDVAAQRTRGVDTDGEVPFRHPLAETPPKEPTPHERAVSPVETPGPECEEILSPPSRVAVPTIEPIREFKPPAQKPLSEPVASPERRVIAPPPVAAAESRPFVPPPRVVPPDPFKGIDPNAPSLDALDPVSVDPVAVGNAPPAPAAPMHDATRTVSPRSRVVELRQHAVPPRQHAVPPDPFSGIDPNAPSIDSLAQPRSAPTSPASSVSQAGSQPNAPGHLVAPRPRAVPADPFVGIDPNAPSLDTIDAQVEQFVATVQQATNTKADLPAAPNSVPAASATARATLRNPTDDNIAEWLRDARQPPDGALQTQTSKAGRSPGAAEPRQTPVMAEPPALLPRPEIGAVSAATDPSPPNPVEPLEATEASSDRPRNSPEFNDWVSEVATPANPNGGAIADAPAPTERELVPRPPSQATAAVSDWLAGSNPAPDQSTPLAETPVPDDKPAQVFPADPFEGLVAETTPEGARAAATPVERSPRSPSRGLIYPLSVRRLNVKPLDLDGESRAAPRTPLVRPSRDDLSVALPRPSFPHSYEVTQAVGAAEPHPAQARAAEANHARNEIKKPAGPRSWPNLTPRLGLWRQWREARAAKAKEKSFRERVAELEAMTETADVAQRR